MVAPEILMVAVTPWNVLLAAEGTLIWKEVFAYRLKELIGSF